MTALVKSADDDYSVLSSCLAFYTHKIYITKKLSASILSVGCVWVATEGYTLRAYTFEPGVLKNMASNVRCAHITLYCYYLFNIPKKTLNLSVISFERF